jgi:virulence factor
VIDYLKVPLKYIVCKSAKSVQLIERYYPSVTGTNNYEEVLNDAEINGILVCASPSAHFELIRKALIARKNVFAEKPVCLSSGELNQLIEAEKHSVAFCQAGMQKRYSLCIAPLAKKLRKQKIISYNYRFHVGAYPEGNVYWDIFIHPVDLVTFLFGEAKVVSILKTHHKGTGRVTILLHLQHGKNVIGALEISSQYAWSHVEETLTVNTETGIFKMKNHQTLTYSEKPKTLLSMPAEKILPHIPEKQYLFNGNNFLPVFENNQLVSQGYFGEILSFINRCEGKSSVNKAPLPSLVNAYNILEAIQSV